MRSKQNPMRRALEKKPGAFKGIPDVVAAQVLIEAGPLRQHLRYRLLQCRRQAAGRRDDAEICEQRRQASLLALDRGCTAGGETAVLEAGSVH